MWLLGDVLLLVFAAVLMAVVLGSASRFVARRTGVGRRFALGLLLFLLFALIGYAAFTGATGIINRANILSAHLQDEFELVARRAVQHRLGQGGDQPGRALLRRPADRRRGAGDCDKDDLAGRHCRPADRLGDLLRHLRRTLYVDGTVRLLPQTWRPRGRATLVAIGETLGWWFLGQLIDMATIGALIFLGLMVLGVPLAGELATIATLFNFVPYVGAICGAAPAVLVALGTARGLRSRSSACSWRSSSSRATSWPRSCSAAPSRCRRC